MGGKVETNASRVLVRNRSTGLSTHGQNKEKGQKAEIAKEK